MDLQIVLELILFILPAYVANAMPVILGGGPKLDSGKSLGDGRRILGDGKTLYGLIGGLMCGILTAAALAATIPDLFATTAAGFGTKLLTGGLLAAGALCGDLAGSFFKRRTGMERGQPSLLLDQLTFLFFALAFAAPYFPTQAGIPGLVFLAVLTFVLHILFNVIAHRLKLKSVPW
ncbi:TPA: CDP-2,3-bis-(O-geranylgeranyl)-sn-glycerol synthase [Candidatus Micrarchaeota archaeon]|nr:MAG: hypothetical protein AUJ65_06180 [Candidatus Micrarchaeota archaeon CG1_02_51_15]HII39104.1 CDP-2,3-bis-(O-geranylgeranyl)-sn-glycerol synthase [Candidatus Micrarchaeota archaeon]